LPAGEWYPRPWSTAALAWTLNIAGTPYRFATRQAACHALLQALARHDAKRVDVGLGQTNLGYHGQRFSSPCEALDPYRNLAVTAALLQEHHAATGDWVLAAGRYHRPAGGTPARVTAPAFPGNSNGCWFPSNRAHHHEANIPYLLFHPALGSFAQPELTVAGDQPSDFTRPIFKFPGRQ
jgi:hypothetical protein